ncbi:hypothetical protein AMECASPLE_037182 [Ameca splendens]|uniref:Uncharacterized protein n=1 Tax=Ameca splendens TaxID=208324 RepID=A0ABV0XKW5_9TELE
MPDKKAGGGGGSGTSRDKWKLRRRGSRLTIQPLFTITEEEEVQRRKEAGRKKNRAYLRVSCMERFSVLQCMVISYCTLTWRL